LTEREETQEEHRGTPRPQGCGEIGANDLVVGVGHGVATGVEAHQD